MNKKVEKNNPLQTEEDIIDWNKILSYLNILRKRKILIIQVLFLFCLLGYVSNQLETPLYRASSQVIILPKPQVIRTGDTYIYTPQLSREAQLQMVQDFKMNENIAKRLKEENKINIEAGAVNFSAVPADANELVMISSINRDAKLAQLIADYAADEFVKRNQEFDSIKMKKAKELIEDQLAIVEKDLIEAEEKLKTFQQKEGLIDVESQAQAKVSQLINLETSTTQAQVEGDVAKAKMDEARSGLGGINIDEKDPLVGSLEQQLADYEIQLAGLRQKWSADHPDVLDMEAKVAETKRKLSQAMAGQESTSKNQMLIESSIEYSGAEAKKEGLSEMVKEEKEYIKTLPEKMVEMKRLERDVEITEIKYKNLLQKAQEAKIEEVTQQGNAEVISYASFPMAPFSPNLMKDIQKFILLGLFLGVLLAFGIEQYNMPLANENDIERHLGLEVLEVIPRSKKSFRKKPLIFNLQNPRGKDIHLREAFRSLRTVINFATRDEEIKSLLITSSVPSEGKSTVAANLAIAYAQMGKNVLLIEADLLRPGLYREFNLPGDVKGLGDYLSGENLSLENMAYDTGIDGLKILPAGKKIKFTSELLESSRMKDLIKNLKNDKNTDLVIFDTPPCQPVTDGIILSSMVDRVVLIVASNMNARNVQRGLKLLENAQANILGVVLNKMETGSGSYYSYKYRYGYYYSEGGEKEDGKKKPENLVLQKGDVKEVEV